MGNEVIGFQTEMKLNRFDYHISYDPTGKAVAKEADVKIYLELQPKRKHKIIMEIIEKLEWRYAAKAMNGKKVPAEK